MGRRFKREGTYAYLWRIQVIVWQEPTQYCKAIILQLKINLKKDNMQIEKEHFIQKKKKKLSSRLGRRSSARNPLCPSYPPRPVCYFPSLVCDCGCDESSFFSAPSACLSPPRLDFDSLLFFLENVPSSTVHSHASYVSFK